MADLHWFPFYAADWLGSAALAAMLPEQEGAYIRLLAVAWGDGSREPSLPPDNAYLAQMSRLGARWKKLGPLVRAQFVVGADGRLVNEKLLAVWQEQQAKHAKASAKASAGGKAKAARTRAPSTSTSTAPGVLQADSGQCLEGAESESEGVVPGRLTPPRVLTPPPDGALAPAGAALRAAGGASETEPTEAELVAERERRGEEPRSAASRMPVVSALGNRPEDARQHVEFTQRRRELEAAFFADLKARAEAWIADHPEESAQLEHDVRDEQGLGEGRELTLWQRTAVREGVYERVREINGWPDSAQWIAEQRADEHAVEPATAGAA